jgi:oligopeptide/dipeptide ABC transporter ATP-binding protein
MNSGDVSAAGAVPAAAQQATADQALLTVRGLSKYFPVTGQGAVVRAVDDLSLVIRRGETFGLVGESGSGKTTAARCILRAVQPTRGKIIFRQRSGREVDLAGLSERELRPLRREMQMIFQDPQSSLDPRMTVRDIVGEPLVVHRLAKGDELRDRVAEALVRVGLKTEHMDRFPAAFSTGQRQRIGIARALVMRPSFVIADEPVSTLDVSVQAQVLNLLKDLQAEFGLTYLFVAHNLDVVRHVCDRVAVMYAGRVIEMSDTKTLFANPRHPYTRALLAAAPVPDPDFKLRLQAMGEVADLANLPAGCAFSPRCPARVAACTQSRPLLKQAESSSVACHLHA